MESYSQPWTVINKCGDKYESAEPKTYEYYATGKTQCEQGREQWQQKHQETSKCGQYEVPEYFNGERQQWYGKHHETSKWGQQEVPEYLNGERKQWYGKHHETSKCGQYEVPEYFNGERKQWYGKHHETSKWGQQEVPEYLNGERKQWYGKHHETSKWGQQEVPEYYNGERQQWYGKHHETSKWGQQELPEYLNGERKQWEQMRHQTSEWRQTSEVPEYLKNTLQGEKREHCHQLEKICGDWERICKNFEGMHLENKHQRGVWGGCEGKNCCDEEMINLVKDMINTLIGCEQSYIQLGFLCMDEKFTLVNTAEFFRLCGLRMRWLAHGLMKRSVRLFNVNEWINNTTFVNWFKVPTKEELATNDFTSIIKTFFKISMEGEQRLIEKMHVLGEKLMKADWMNTECRFEGFKWFINFVLPYQMHFVKVMKTHFQNIEMCDNGYIFDKCEMYPLVHKVEELIHQLVKNNTIFNGNHKTVIITETKKW